MFLKYIKQKENYQKKDPYLIQIEYANHLNQILRKNWELILKYRSAQKTLNNNSDICNDKLYNKKQLIFISGTIIIFADEASFSKSSTNNKMWAILGNIVEMPP